MKRNVALLLIVFILLCIVGCGPSDAKPSPTEEDGRLIGVSYFLYTNQHFIDFESGVLPALRDGDRYIKYDAQNDINKQIDQIEDMLAMGIDALLVAPADVDGIKAALESCKKANVPVFVFDTKVTDDDLVVSQIVSDNYMAGKLGAELIVKKLGDKEDVNIVIIEASFNNACNERSAGFTDVIEAQPNFTIIDRRDAMGTIDTAIPIMEDYLQSYGKIDALFGTNDAVAIGGSSVLKSANRLEGVVIVSVDGSEDGKDMIRAGEMTGTAAQFPVEMGKTAMGIAYDYLDGKEVEHLVYIPVELITIENVDG